MEQNLLQFSNLSISGCILHQMEGTMESSCQRLEHEDDETHFQESRNQAMENLHGRDENDEEQNAHKGLHESVIEMARKGEKADEFISREFGHHDPSVARINNGSFGSCPASVLHAQARWQQLWLQQPDHFYYNHLHNALLASRLAIAPLIHATHVQQLYLVDNVTTAVSMVLQRVAWDFIQGRYQKDDAVLGLNWTYGAVKQALKAYPLRAGAQLVEVKLPFPLSSKQQIISSFHKAFHSAKMQSKRIRFALIDHITSMPSVVLPIEELVRLCRSNGVDEVFVDGAHAFGSVEFNVEEIDADYYCSNLHKWGFTPPTVAFLHCKRKHLSFLHHPIVSQGYAMSLEEECDWVGTRDYSAELTVVDALSFFNNFKGGIDAVRECNHNRVVAMGEMLAKAWGTGLGAPPEMFSTMAMVRLPSTLGITSNDLALSFRSQLRAKFGVELPVCVESMIMPDGNKEEVAYARISHQIYNKVEDYIRLKNAVMSIAVTMAQSSGLSGNL